MLTEKVTGSPGEGERHSSGRPASMFFTLLFETPLNFVIYITYIYFSVSATSVILKGTKGHFAFPTSEFAFMRNYDSFDC